MAKIPDGWTYCTSELSAEAAWAEAVRLKAERERLRPDLMVRMRVMPGSGSGRDSGRGSFWVLRKDETRVKETAT